MSRSIISNLKLGIILNNKKCKIVDNQSKGTESNNWLYKLNPMYIRIFKQVKDL